MDKDNTIEEKTCVRLDRTQLENLARSIIDQTRQEFRYGTDRGKRMAAPSGAVILF